MSLNRFGFHALAQWMGDGLDHTTINLCARYQPRLMVVQDGDVLAARILDVSPNTLVVQKRWRPDESTAWRNVTPEDYVKFATTATGQPHTQDRRVLVYVLNEPAAYGEDITTLCNWLIAVGDECHKHGYRAVLGNIGPAIYPPDVIESGRFDDYLRYLADEAQKPDGHFAGWHEYTGYFLPFGAGLYDTNDLRHPERLQQDWHNVVTGNIELEMAYAYHAMQRAKRTGPDIEWPYPDDPTRKPYANWWLYEGQPDDKTQIVFPGWWHLLRSQWFELYAASKGIGKHKKLITEFGWDDMPDLAPTGIRDYLTQSYGIPDNDYGVPYKGLRGGRTLANVWRAWWPHWSFEEAVYQQLVWADQNYPEDYIGFALFTINRGSDWDRDWGFNWGALPALHDRLINHVEPDPPPTDREVGITEFGLLIALGIVLGVVVLIYLANYHIQSEGVSSMELNDLLIALWQIPPIAVVSYTASIVLVLVEVWKRYLYPRLPVVLQWSPQVVAVFLVAFFLLLHTVAATYAYDDTLQEIVVFITKVLDAIGPYFLTSVLGLGVTNWGYNKLRGSETPGFNADNPAKS